MLSRVLGSLVVACALAPGAADAQPLAGSSGSVGYDETGRPYSATTHGPRAKHGHRFDNVVVGVGVGHSGFPYGPRVAPPWNYPGLAGGPFVTYPYGYPGFYYPGIFYHGRAGSSWSNGLSLYGPPVPVYGPIPGVFGNEDLVRQWRSTLAPGLAGYGWVGIYAASPRPRHPTVSSWPVVEQFQAPGVNTSGSPVPAAGGCLVISVKVPQPAAEVWVDGKKTVQTGTDRTFESPPLEGGKSYRYTVTARWVERGQTFESSREAIGAPGEVIRVDFGTLAAGK
jgi:uncharacterized protein (TIGR03000 family)